MSTASKKTEGTLSDNIWKDLRVDSNLNISFKNYNPTQQEQKVLQNCMRMMSFGMLAGTTVGLGFGGLSVRVFKSPNPNAIMNSRPVKALFIGSFGLFGACAGLITAFEPSLSALAVMRSPLGEQTRELLRQYIFVKQIDEGGNPNEIPPLPQLPPSEKDQK